MKWDSIEYDGKRILYDTATGEILIKKNGETRTIHISVVSEWIPQGWGIVTHKEWMDDRPRAAPQKRILNKLFRAGQTLVFTSGEYSDYAIIAIARVYKDFELKDVSMDQDKLNGYYACDYIVNSMREQGFIELVEYEELNLGEIIE